MKNGPRSNAGASAPDLSALPAGLRNTPRWLVWKSIPHPADPTKKPRKVPFYTDGRTRQGALDTPEDWASLAPLAEATAVLESGNYTGLGFALGPDADGNFWQGIDLDGTDTQPQLAALVETLPGYTERSPSGKGWHALGVGQKFESLGSNTSGIEAYASGRYFTVTGCDGRGDLEDLAPFVTGTLASLHKPAKPKPARPTNHAPINTSNALISDLRAALSAIRADDYETWIRMGHALAELGEQGRALWLEWSQTSDKYQPSDAKRWAGFKGDRAGYVAVFAEARDHWGWVNPSKREAKPRSADGEPDLHSNHEDEPPLTRAEAESLIAWAWSTGTTLPRKPAGLFTYRTLKNQKGEPKTRDAMRSPISGFNTYSAPWIELGWHTTKADFMGEVAKYLPNRANIVMAQAEKNGTVPNDVSPDVLIADAQLWLNRVSSLVVNDTIGRELLARVPANKAESNTKNDAVGVKYQCANSFTVEPIEWLWKGWLAAGKLHILAGAPGTGKTTVALALAATISVAGRWPDGTGANRGRVMIWSGEDDPCDTIVPRLMANGADLSRVNIITGTIGKNGERGFDPGTDLQALTDTIAKMEEPPALLIVDPIVSAVAGDSHKNAEVRRALQPLVELAMQRRCAVLGISHFSKGTQGRDPVERVTGSLAFGALARIVLAAAKLPDEEGGGRILARGKSNIGKDDGGFKYELVVVNPRPDIETTAVLWAEAVEGSARELLGQAEGQADSEERSATREAQDWLREFLSHGAAKAKDVQREARECGIGEKALRTARERLGIKPTKSGFQGSYMWTLPSSMMPKMPNDAKDAQEILFGKSGHHRHHWDEKGIIDADVYGDETSFSCSKTQHDSDDTGVF